MVDAQGVAEHRAAALDPLARADRVALAHQRAAELDLEQGEFDLGGTGLAQQRDGLLELRPRRGVIVTTGVDPRRRRQQVGAGARGCLAARGQGLTPPRPRPGVVVTRSSARPLGPPPPSPGSVVAIGAVGASTDIWPQYSRALHDQHDPDATRPTDGVVDEPARLVVLADDGATYVPLPVQGTVRIGRGEDVEVRIDRDSVSRRHASLHLGPPLTIEDNGSSNGTKVAGVRLAPHVATAIAPGDVIELGKVTVLVQGGGSRGAPVRLQGRAAIASPEMVPRIAASDINVLVLGETGVGKEVMARRIHELSRRSGGPLVAINCGAVPETLIESELFGHEAGAFTGATRPKTGLLESAAGGTVFLDEVGELPALAQVKLLRVLEDRRVQRVGSVVGREIDVRFVAATHRDLRADIAAGRFRQDLYYRLNGITLAIPPLRDRLAEIPALVEQFVAQAATRLGIAAPSVAPAAVGLLRSHTWPGNIRELRNVIERAMVLCDGPVLTTDHIVIETDEVAPSPASALPTAPVGDAPEGDERARILAALQQCAGNQTRAAELLGIARKTLGLKMDALGIPRPQKSRP